MKLGYSLASFFGILPDSDASVSPFTRLRLSFLALGAWFICSFIASSTYHPIQVGVALPTWIALWYLSPCFIAPLFLYFCLKTSEQWRAFMLCLYLSLPVYLGALLLIPSGFSLGDLPTLPVYSHIVFPGNFSGSLSVMEISLPMAPLLFVLLMHVHVASNFPNSWLKLITLGYWASLVLIPINSGLISYTDILLPPCLLGIIIFILCKKQTSRS